LNLLAFLLSLTALFLINQQRNSRDRNSLTSKMPIPMVGEKPSTSNIEPNPATDSSIPGSATAQANTGTGTSTSSQTKTEAEEAADRLYEERIEEEYAKREGGA
jgi:hypothetical protein